MNKNAIQKFAIWARSELIEQVKQRAYQYAITDNGHDDENATVIAGRVLSPDEKRQRRSFVELIKINGFKQVVEEVAYTWFNRFVALRYMEVNDFLPTHVRVFSDASGAFNPAILKDVLHLDLKGLDKAKVSELLNANKTGELYRYLLLTQCNALNALLPEMFERMGAYTEMLLPNNILKPESVIGRLVKDIPEEDFRDAVQIIGWLYQYYNDERKNEVINIYKGTVKKADIPAATQLFTTDWVVKYMVDNSLGRYWLERNPESKLHEKLEYFVPPKDGNLNIINEKIEPSALTFLDPCMGSGHILVYAFDVLMEIYRECGYSDRDAALSILQNNLFGLDIDDRAYQLAYFAVMMKARSYNRRILSIGINPHIRQIQESNDIGEYYNANITKNKEMNTIGEYLIEKYRHAKEIGSIQIIEPKDYLAFYTYMDECEKAGPYDIEGYGWMQYVKPRMQELAEQAEIMSKKYAVVATNPPYLNKMESHLKDFVLNEYKPYSGDLFSVFIYRNFGFCKADGYSAFMSPFVWMFIKTYENLRRYIIENKSITTLIQMEYSAFEEATVPICSFVLKNGKDEQNGLYFKLSDFRGGMEVQKQKVLEALADKDCKYFFASNADSFKKIPGMPVAYWVSIKFLSAFAINKKLSKEVTTRLGMATANNDLFVRAWFEIEHNNIGFSFSNRENAKKSKKRWFPYNKGGNYRRWYGNQELVVDWENDGYRIQNFKDERTGRVRSHNYNLDYIFKEGITWSALSSSYFSARSFSNGFLFDDKGSSAFMNPVYKKFILGYLNSKVASAAMSILNPTISFQPGDLSDLPLKIDNLSYVESIVENCLTISCTDWDSFETSWDFIRHPLISGEQTVSVTYARWESEATLRFDTLKANEEELNRIFIDIYGLQDELTPEVEDKDVTVRRADLGREIRSLISYAVGCMLGRYSLDSEGLAYAGGDWDAGMYQTFPADKDNILPICDDEYFDDDILGRFVEFIKTVYGADTLEENLRFIADALGGKGTPREVIRNYFLNDFYRDHVKVYHKRPIYWMFESGKKNGFKALIYMHRYSSDLLAKLRTDYVHEQQERYRTQLSHIVGALNTATGAERARLLKRQDKLTEQLRELTAFEEKVHHLADQSITIDLDNGVKKNYEIYADVMAKI
jgi:hypothetical protein